MGSTRAGEHFLHGLGIFQTFLPQLLKVFKQLVGTEDLFVPGADKARDQARIGAQTAGSVETILTPFRGLSESFQFAHLPAGRKPMRHRTQPGAA